jgi:hypothetical protein
MSHSLIIHDKTISARGLKHSTPYTRGELFHSVLILLVLFQCGILTAAGKD